MKFKVGDIVRIYTYDRFNDLIGIIRKVDNDDFQYPYDLEVPQEPNQACWFKEEELRKLTKLERAMR